MIGRRLKVFLAILGIFCGNAHSAVPSDPSVAGAHDSRVSVLTAEQVIQILDQTVDWYRTLGAQQQNATQPSDLLILFANRQTADQVVSLALEIARANAELLSSEAGVGQNAPDASSSRSLSQQQAQLDAQRASIEAEIAALKEPGASARDKNNISAKRIELEGELAMVAARRNLLDTMAEFTDQNSPKQASVNALKAHVNAIAATLPTLSATPASATLSTATPTTAVPASASFSAIDAKTAGTRSGIWDLGVTAVNLRKKIKSIDLVDQHTASLAKTFLQVSDLPLKQLKAYSARSDALAAQADAANGAALVALRAEFDTLAWLFKQTSAILLPLSKEQVLLSQYRHNLQSWREATQREYYDALRALGIRLGILAAILTAVFVLAEVWRRAVNRYAHEPRRRYQLLLIRKIVMWTAVIVIVGLSFATQISAFATFAGLLTAGVAVAMQSVLVSVVGYFFLIGKYGIRVGDRIQIGTVVGEVIDIGLVRMHLMELHTNGPLGPTGRVVAFANLIVFQASGGLFKQIPGVNISWHEITVTLPRVSDYAALKQQLLTAVGNVVNEYRDEIVRQTKEIERSTATAAADDAVAQVQMHLAEGRMVALIRYPVHLQHAAEMDERVSDAILTVIPSNEAA
ncbi:MAG: mechanosensitive ion channel family protein [Pseudomonadota bacterium]|nr:mechanosensitive ion channel family protein [Pseudomonadota bacterium]